MKPDEFIAIREALGLDHAQLAELMNVRPRRIEKVENSEDDIKGPMISLIQAYAAGYRPADWPDPAE